MLLLGPSETLKRNIVDVIGKKITSMEKQQKKDKNRERFVS